MSRTDDIEHALRMLNDAFAKGAISEAHYEAHDARLRARQADIRAWREGDTSRNITAPNGARTFGEQALAALPTRRPIRLDLPVRVIRRRGLAYGGMLPPAIAKTFTVGQAAVLSVVAWEHMNRGACRKSYAEIADEAGCSRRWVKETIQLAKVAGILSVEHRPRPGRKDDTNVVRIVSADWLAWIKVRAERQERGRRAAIGGSRVPPSPNGSRSRGGFVPAYRPAEAPSGAEEAAEGQGRRA